MSSNTKSNQELIQKAYQAFNDRDIDIILQMMHPDIKWSRAWEGDYAQGHNEVRAYWQRQWKEINPIVTPAGFNEKPNGTFEFEVDQVVKDLNDNILFEGKVKHIYTIEDGLLKQMDIEQY